MERLTYKDANGEWVIACNQFYRWFEHKYPAHIKGAAVTRLAAYEDTGKTPEEVAALVQAESEGRVDIHPCTEGTAVYVIREVRNHYLEPYHYEIQVMAYKKYMLKNYGKTVFLEKGAAEAALREGE